jgi:hypothetical protein
MKARRITARSRWTDPARSSVQFSALADYACRACMLAGGATEAEITRRFRNPTGVRPAARDPLVGGNGHPR